MKQNYIKFFIGLLCMVWLSAFAVPTTAHAEESEDTRTHIDRVDISTNIDSVFDYGNDNTTLEPDLQMSQTTSEPVTISPYYGKWQRCVDGNWVSDCEKFISGQWRMMIHIRVNDNDANLVDDETKVYVDGELWETWVAYDYGDANAYIVVIPSEDSERFFIEEPAELTFHKLEKYDISGQRVNSVIESYSVAPSVEGGTRPYSYKKASGPDWLEVSNEGIISGKPTEIGENDPLVVEVLDSNGGSKQITISVGDTLEENIIEVSTWEELEAAFQWNKPEGLYTTSQREMEYFTIRLMEDLSTNVASLTYTDTVAKTFAIYRAYVTFDFNGHTLSCRDDISSSNYEYQFKDFIRIELHPNSYDEGSALRFIDSVGGGGIEMYSSRAFETCDLSALHLVSGEKYHYIVNSSAYNNSNADHYVYFDGGKYELEARSEKVSIGTLSRDVRYRGCVIAEDVRVEINDGHFYANGEGAKFSVGDTCARELAAFGTFAVGVFNYAVPIELVIAADGSDSVVINGGIFESNGYAVHHFDDAIDQGEWGWSWGYMNFPTINGGYFIGQMGYTGHTFTYSDGTEFYNVLPATTIISKDSYVIGIDKDGDRFYDLEDMTLKDLHDLQSCIVLGKETVQMKTSPVAGSYPASLIRESTQTETYTIEYKEPSWFTMGGIQCVPYYSIQGWNSGVTPTSKTGKTEVTVDYSKYKHNGGVNVSLGVMYLTPWNTTDYSFENEYNVELQVFYDVTDACENCYITPVNGEYRVFDGDDFSFKITADKNYEINTNGSLEVSIDPSNNAGEVTWDSATNTYTVPDVVGDISISVNKNTYGPTGVLQLKLEIRTGVLTDLGSQLAGTTYTLKTQEEYKQNGLVVPNGYTLEKWTVTMNGESRSFSSGESITLSGAGYVIISPKYENLYNIQVINGKAYADAEHTQQISNAKDGKYVYIVADPPETGKVFWRWKVIDGYNGIPVGEYANPETTYYVNMDDALLEACYATPIDEVTLTILTEDIVPEAGMQVPSLEKVNRDAYSFYPLYYYDVTDGGHTMVFPETQNFEAGHIYQLETRVSKVDGYLLADIEDMTLHIEGLSESEYESAEFQTVQNYENEEYKIIIRFPEIEGPEGVNVSGTITSFGSEGSCVEVTLTNVDNESISYKRLLVGNSATYSIDGVMPGTYTLSVDKAYHMDFETTVVVGEVDVVQDVTLEVDENIEIIQNATIKHNCSFGSDFTLVYAIPKSELEGFENIRLSVEKDVYSGDTLTGTETVVLDWVTYLIGAEEYYRFDYKNILSYQIGNELRATLIAEYNGEEYRGTVDEYSIKEYAYNRLTKSSDDTFKRMLVDMLDYCAASQSYFTYRETFMVNEDLTSAQRELSTGTYAALQNNEATVKELENKTISAIKKNVNFGNRIEPIFAMDLSNYPDRSNITLHVEYTDYKGQAQEINISGDTFVYNSSISMYYGAVSTLNAAELRKVLEVKVLYNGVEVSDTIAYSIETYVCKKLASSSDEAFKNLLQELMVYGDSSEAYFN